MKRTVLALAFSFVATAASADSVHSLVTQVAQAHGVPVQMAHAVVQAESRYRCNARNRNNHGIMQVNPRTALGVGVRGSLFDCRTGLEAGMRYLAKAVRTVGPGCAALTAYNSGNFSSARCSAYGRKIMARMSNTRIATR